MSVRTSAIPHLVSRIASLKQRGAKAGEDGGDGSFEGRCELRAEGVGVGDFDGKDADTRGHGQVELFPERQGFADAQEMRGTARETFQSGGVELVHGARRHAASLDGIHEDDLAVAGEEVEQRKAHLLRLANVEACVAGEFVAELADEKQADGVIREDVVAEAEQQNFGGGVCLHGVRGDS